MRIRLSAVEIPPELSGEDPDFFETALARGRQKAMVALGEEAILQINESIHQASPRPPEDTGTLARRESWQYELDADAKAMVVGPIPPVFPRAVVMEAGRAPGAKMPPVGVIQRWVERKGLADRAARLDAIEEQGVGVYARGRRRRRRTLKSFRSRKASHARSLAFVIARSIARKGILPRNFVRDARPGVEARGQELLEAFTTEALNERLPGGAG